MTSLMRASVRSLCLPRQHTSARHSVRSVWTGRALTHTRVATQRTQLATTAQSRPTRRHSTRTRPVLSVANCNGLRLDGKQSKSYEGHSAEGSSSKWSRWLRWGAAGAAAAALLAASDEAQACGIVAFIGEEPCVQYLLEGLLILQNRGYDSAGVSTIDRDGNVKTTKYASKGSTSDSIDLVVKEATEKHKEDLVGIAHTRWATHGGKTDENAHPHLDYKNRISLAHNGTIENSDTIKAELEAIGIPFRSHTDTEVIVQLIGHYLDQEMPLVEAVKKALSRLEGTWGIVLISKDHPNQVIAARNGSPLVVGVGKDRMFVASEVSAFSRHCKEFVSLKDGEIAVISSNKDVCSLDLTRTETAAHEDIKLSPKPFPNWTIKEIMEQPEAVARALGFGGRFGPRGEIKLGGLDMNEELMTSISNLCIAACGTSYYASMYGAHLMRELGSFNTVQVTDASEFFSENVPQDKGGLLVVSQSGETKDVHRAVECAADNGIPRFSVVNTVGSLIARTTKCGVYLNAGRENAVASTKAFTTQVTALAMIAAWFSERHSPMSTQKRADLTDALHRLPVYIGMTLKCHEQVRGVAEKIRHADNMFVLGKGLSYPIAMEGALKIKEISYIHAEGYSGGALKHGPFALLDKGVPVVMMVMDDQHAEMMRIAAAQVRARGAHTIIITDQPRLAKGIADDTIVVPSNGPLTPLLAVVPLQLLAYELSLLRGNDPDKPRHLAKAVTVD